MACYKIFFKQSAEKELRKIPQPFLSQILSKIEGLVENPRPVGVQMLKGAERYYRLRQGDYRIVFEVDDAALLIAIIKIGHRREVYDHL